MNASSITGTQAIYLNGTQVGTTNYSAILAAGFYNFTANTSSNANFTAVPVSYFANVSQAASTVNLTESHSWSMVYGTAVNITCSPSNNQSAIGIYLNGTQVGTTNYSAILAAGSYNVSCNSSGSQNYTASPQASSLLTITQAAGMLNLSISPGLLVSNGTNTSVSCTMNNNQSVFSLYRNGTQIANSSANGSVLWDNATLPYGAYNYTCNASSSQNYTAASASSILTVESVSCALSPGVPSIMWLPAFSDLNYLYNVHPYYQNATYGVFGCTVYGSSNITLQLALNDTLQYVPEWASIDGYSTNRTLSANYTNMTTLSSGQSVYVWLARNYTNISGTNFSRLISVIWNWQVT